MTQLPYTFTTEFKDYPHTGQFRGGMRLVKSLDWDAYYEQLDKDAAETRARLVEVYGEDRVHNWLKFLPEANTIQDDLIAMKAVLAGGEVPAALTCQHENTVGETRGAMHFAGGEIWDSLSTVTICLDCHMVIVDQPKSDEIPY